MPRTRAPYPPEFRREAIRLLRAPDEKHPIPRVAKELGVTAETLRDWLKQDEIDSGENEKASPPRSARNLGAFAQREV